MTRYNYTLAEAAESLRRILRGKVTKAKVGTYDITHDSERERYYGINRVDNMSFILSLT